MKKVFAAIALVASFAAQAETFEASNNAGGKIVLTERDCVVSGKTYSGWYAMYSTIPSGDLVRGCWTVADKRVHVVYNDGTSRVYDIDSFIKID